MAKRRTSDRYADWGGADDGTALHEKKKTISTESDYKIASYRNLPSFSRTLQKDSQRFETMFNVAIFFPI